MVQTPTPKFRLVFASSSEFTLPILQDIIKNQGKTILEIYQEQCLWLKNNIQNFKAVFPKLPENISKNLNGVSAELELTVELWAVISQPDRVHRGKTHSNPIVKYAREQNLTLFTPEKLNNSLDEFAKIFGNDKNYEDGEKLFDTAIIASYGQIVSSKVLALAKYGFMNWHPSLLPAFRGPTPMPSLIAQGVSETGLSWIEMTKAMDAGDIWLQVVTELMTNKNLEDLTQDMVQIGLNTWSIPIVSKLLNTYNPLVQDHLQATFTKMLNKQDRMIEPNQLDALAVYRYWLAYKKYPGVSFEDKYFQGEVRLLEIGAPVDNLPSQNILYQDKHWVCLKTQNLEVFLKSQNGFVPVQSIQSSTGQSIKFQGFQFKEQAQ